MQRERLADEGSTDGFLRSVQRAARELLESQSIGRVAWHGRRWSADLPVTYACHDGTIIFRTSYGVLSELIRPTDVALEIDELDQDRRRGWSVVVKAGHRVWPSRPARPHVDRWRGRSVGIRGQERVHQIIPQRITGRVLAGTVHLKRPSSRQPVAQIHLSEGTLVPVLWDRPSFLASSCRRRELYGRVGESPRS